MIDNLFDLTHAHFLHRVDGEHYLRPDMEGEERDGRYYLTIRSRSPWSDYHDFLYTPAARFEGVADTVSVTILCGPGLIKTSPPLVVAIDGMDQVPAHFGTINVMHGITPATEHSHHYFVVQMRNFRLDDRGFDEGQLQFSSRVRQEDIVAIEAIEERMDAASAVRGEMLSRADRPAVRVKQLIDRMIDAESREHQPEPRGPVMAAD